MKTKFITRFKNSTNPLFTTCGIKAILFFVCFGFMHSAQAQTEKGKILLGGTADISLSFQGDVRNFNMAFSPSLAVFAVTNFAIGGRYSFGVGSRRAFNVSKNEYRSTTGFTPAVGPILKYYIGKKPFKGVVSTNASYLVFTQLTKGNVDSKEGFTFGGSLGMAYFFNPHVGLETAFYVNTTGYKGDFPITRGGISVGIFTIIDKKKKD